MSGLRLLLVLLVAAGLLSAGWALWKSQDPPPLASLRVEVLNGCGTDGLAGEFATVLRRMGQEVVRVDDAERQDHPRTLLIDRRGRPVLTRRLAARLGDLPVLLERTEGARVDVTVILGADAPSLDVLTSPPGVLR